MNTLFKEDENMVKVDVLHVQTGFLKMT